MIKHTLSAAAIALSSLAAQADTLALWNFNNEDLQPSAGAGAGAGSLATIGGVSTSYAAGPLGNSQGDRALNTAGYPAATAAPRTAGIEFSVSTVGFENVSLSYDGRHSGTAARHESVLVSAGGGTFVALATFAYTDTLFAPRTVDLSGLAATDNTLLTFRIVADFAPGENAYAGTTSSYSSGGTMRFDNIALSGTPIPAVPEPATTALLLGGLALLGALARRRAG